MKQSGRYQHSINNNNGYVHNDILNEYDWLPEMTLPPAIHENSNNQNGYDNINNVGFQQQQQQQQQYEPPIINKVLSTKSYYSHQTATEEQ
eukprot:UN09223